ncbi:MAG: beta-propeller fold lactonase family protein [Edaphobacter sp.]|uniref:lactonase family protein n=1 Tax=Edaphobacter sp. TaxID=1934404 RepID=UPI0023875EE1|nr:beta-propeller fold lactonase family protein [Edaphobacter sp.]MDE1175982.1 beta-propeller fold lactonase family protein [Edaphobacter sp.]
MTLKTMGRGAIASVVSVAMGLGLTACGRDYTVGYLYNTSGQNATGFVNGYKIDYQQGYLVQLANSPISSGGRYPITVIASPDHLSIYVVNRDDSNVVHFLIGTDGKIYPQKTYTITGSFATDASIDASGKFLYVTFTYQNAGTQQLYTAANPGPGGLSIFPISSDGSLGSPTTYNLGRAPVKVAANNPNHFVYVIGQDTATSANLFGFSQDTTTGALTALPGITINSGNVASTGFDSGVLPNGIIVDAAGSHLYVTDKTSNTVLGYSIASNGVPSLIGSATTGNQPAGMTIDSTGKYLYVASYADGAVNGYTFSSNGAPVVSTTSSSTQAGTGTTCVTTMNAPSTGDPSHAVYLYASNQLSNNITGTQMSQTDGSLSQIQHSPFGANTLPTCLVAVPAVPGR